MFYYITQFIHVTVFLVTFHKSEWFFTRFKLWYIPYNQKVSIEEFHTHCFNQEWEKEFLLGNLHTNNIFISKLI